MAFLRTPLIDRDQIGDSPETRLEEQVDRFESCHCGQVTAGGEDRRVVVCSFSLQDDDAFLEAVREFDLGLSTCSFFITSHKCLLFVLFFVSHLPFRENHTRETSLSSFLSPARGAWCRFRARPTVRRSSASAAVRARSASGARAATRGESRKNSLLLLSVSRDALRDSLRFDHEGTLLSRESL